jgi:DNA-binding transcriptional regulator YiaG
MGLDDCYVVDVEPKYVLTDYVLRVGFTDLHFVAGLPALVTTSGPQFSAKVLQAMWTRAASTLTQMGLMRGQTFQFIRLGLPMTEAEVATMFNVLVSDVQDWESEAVPVPLNAWRCLAAKIDKKDGRYSSSELALCPPGPSYRYRMIRIYPDIPQEPMPQNTGDACPPNPC